MSVCERMCVYFLCKLQWKYRAELGTGRSSDLHDSAAIIYGVGTEWPKRTNETS